MPQEIMAHTGSKGTTAQRAHTRSSFPPLPKSQHGALPHSAAPGSTGSKVQFQPRIPGELPREDLLAELAPWQCILMARRAGCTGAAFSWDTPTPWALTSFQKLPLNTLGLPQGMLPVQLPGIYSIRHSDVRAVCHRFGVKLIPKIVPMLTAPFLPHTPAAFPGISHRPFWETLSVFPRMDLSRSAWSIPKKHHAAEFGARTQILL